MIRYGEFPKIVERYDLRNIFNCSETSFSKKTMLNKSLVLNKGDPERCAGGNLRTEDCARKLAPEETSSRKEVHGCLEYGILDC